MPLEREVLLRVDTYGGDYEQAFHKYSVVASATQCGRAATLMRFLLTQRRHTDRAISANAHLRQLGLNCHK